MGLDTNTYWLTDRQSQCDFDFDFDLINQGEAGREVRSTRNSSEQFKSELRRHRTEEVQNSQKWSDTRRQVSA
jgi:hypothetical protein